MIIEGRVGREGEGGEILKQYKRERKCKAVGLRKGMGREIKMKEGEWGE